MTRFVFTLFMAALLQSCIHKHTKPNPPIWKIPPTWKITWEECKQVSENEFDCKIIRQ